MSFVAQIRAENYGRLLAEGLTRFADRYGIPTEDNLVIYLLSRGTRDPALARSLAKAMHHFWHHDTESCIHLAAPKVEAAAARAVARGRRFRRDGRGAHVGPDRLPGPDAHETWR